MIDTSERQINHLRKTCLEIFKDYQSDKFLLQILNRQLLKGYWEQSRMTYAIVAMLAKIARLVKEVRELRKENERLIEYNAWIMQRYGVTGKANMADGKVKQ